MANADRAPRKASSRLLTARRGHSTAPSAAAQESRSALQPQLTGKYPPSWASNVAAPTAGSAKVSAGAMRAVMASRRPRSEAAACPAVSVTADVVKVGLQDEAASGESRA